MTYSKLKCLFQRIDKNKFIKLNCLKIISVDTSFDIYHNNVKIATFICYNFDAFKPNPSQYAYLKVHQKLTRYELRILSKIQSFFNVNI